MSYNNLKVAPGQKLHYAQVLQSQLKESKSRRNTAPALIPDLMVPFVPADKLQPNSLRVQFVIAGDYISSCSAENVRLLDIATGQTVVNPKVNNTYTVKCDVINRGAGSCYSGIAELYADTRSAMDRAKKFGMGLRPISYQGFTVPAFGKTTLTFKWTVASTDKTSLIIQAYETFQDKVITPFNNSDKHVIRVDYTELSIANQKFSGKWTGNRFNFRGGLPLGTTCIITPPANNTGAYLIQINLITPHGTLSANATGTISGVNRLNFTLSGQDVPAIGTFNPLHPPITFLYTAECSLFFLVSNRLSFVFSGTNNCDSYLGDLGPA